VSSRHDIFYNLQEYKASINDAGGRTHQITRIGSVYVHGVEIPDVQYTPTITANLLSFRQLDKQNFDISLLSNIKEKRFLIKSPIGASLDAYPAENSDLYQVKPIACAVRSAPRTKPKQADDQTNGQKDHGPTLPTATIEE
jgi:hypothetical protein